jgi:hypothetical protein
MQMRKQILTAFALFGFVNGAYATDIELTWQTPTEREDGSAITAIDRFNIYHSVDNVVQEPIEVQANAINHTLVDVASGSYTFQISTVESGLEGELSDPVNVDVAQSKPVKIELTVRVVD